MSQKHFARIRLVSGVIQSVSIAAAAVCLMTACVSIYRMGGRPFSREAVAEAFGPIALPVYLCLALVIGGFLLDLFLPGDDAKPKAKRQTALILRRLQSKTDLDSGSAELRAAVLAQRTRRATLKKIRTALLILCTVTFLCYGANPDNFHQTEINTSMINAMLELFPSLAVCFIYALFVERHTEASMEKEIELLKQAPPAAAAAEAPAAPAVKISAVRTVILVIGAAFLIYGFFAGGTVDVLTKAINICTECVGLG